MYFNPFTGAVQYVNYPPIVNAADALVPTVNCCSYCTDTGEINTMIAPVNTMIGDTLVLTAKLDNGLKTATIKIVLE